MSWLLPRLVGLRRAQEIILTNCRVSAADAAAMGLITRVVAPENLMDEGLALAHALANGPLGAIGGARALLAQGFGNDLATQFDLEATRIAEAGTTAGEFRGQGVPSTPSPELPRNYHDHLHRGPGDIFDALPNFHERWLDQMT